MEARYYWQVQLYELSEQGEVGPPVDEATPSLARTIYENKEGLQETYKWMLDDIAENFGKKVTLGKTDAKALGVAERELKQKLAEIKLTSSRVAQANRDFTLLNYGEKTYADIAAAYLYPFHFWYTRTYANWLKRVAINPAALANYARYKDTLATVHAGMPEWWKYQLNTNDLPGIEMDNPLYFNLRRGIR